MPTILPSGPQEGPPGRPWSRWHLRLHQHLRRQPALLPPGSALLLAVSGGQDSMALSRLLLDLCPLHGWSLQLWHGDHGWHSDSADRAAALAAWAESQGLPIRIEQAEAPASDEAAARQWRYGRLEALAREQGINRVVTGHTASDRAETLLLHLARGSHRRGLASLRPRRPLSTEAAGEGIELVRPLLIFGRQETAHVCADAAVPIWADPSNDDLRYSRNRIRQQVLPVLEELHPGASRRLAGLAERLAAEDTQQQELQELAVRALRSSGHQNALDRRALVALSRSSQALVLQHWLEQHCGRRLPARQLDLLLDRLPPPRGPGSLALPGGWQLRWTREELKLTSVSPESSHA